MPPPELVDPPRNAREAAPWLAVAWIAEMGDAPLPRATRQALLSISLFEAGWGNSHYPVKDPYTGEIEKVPNDNNWGSIHCPGGGGEKTPENPLGQRLRPRGNDLWSHCVRGSDKLSRTGKRFITYFRGYDSPVDGAQDYVRILRPVLDVMATGDAQKIAEAMKPVYRYGVTINEYAHAIDVSAPSVARSLGEPNLIARHKAPAPTAENPFPLREHQRGWGAALGIMLPTMAIAAAGVWGAKRLGRESYGVPLALASSAVYAAGTAYFAGPWLFREGFLFPTPVEEREGLGGYVPNPARLHGAS